MSVSILTLSPIFFEPKFVIFIVCGIKQIEILFLSTSTSVKLIPSIVIDPFFTTNLAKSLGSSIQNLISFVSFSISINHTQTYTGITDRDRALTISEMAHLYKNTNGNKKEIFVSSFKTPGHVPLLIAAERLLSDRLGHTEMSVYMTNLAGLCPTAAICEMLDSETHTALSIEKAKKYAKENAIPYFDGNELVKFTKEH